MTILRGGVIYAVFAVWAGHAASLRSSSFIGGNCTTIITAVALDGQGYVYETGATTWPDFPTTPGPLSHFYGANTTCTSPTHIFVRKFKPDGVTVVYSVLVGGSGGAESSAMAVDQQGNVYVTGSTSSPDFPVVPPASLSHLPNGKDSDVYVFKLNPSGTALEFSRVFGGDGLDRASSLALAPDGRIVLAGWTRSNGIPITSTALQSAPATGDSGFVIRLQTDGSLDYGTYLGGTGGANATGVAVDRGGDIYVAGYAGSFFPTTANSLAPRESSGGFVARIDAVTGRFVYSTYLPGVQGAYWQLIPSVALPAVQVQVDSNSNVYVSGSAGAGFPATAGAFQREPYTAADEASGFVLEMDPAGRSLIFATLIGGTQRENIYALALTGSTVTVAGRAWSADFPATDYSLPRCNLASFDSQSMVFLASFDHSGKLLTSVEYGNCGRDVATGMAATSASSVWMAANYSESANSLLASIDMTAAAPVQVAAVINSASFQIGPVAPLEVVTVFGSGLGPKKGIAAPAGDRFPLSLGGVQLLFGGRPAPLLFVQDHQINAVVPGTGAGGSISATSSSANAVSATLSTAGAPAAPALFTADGSGIGQGAILNEDGSINSASNPAPRGSVVTLFGTGGGLTNPVFADGETVPVAAPLSLPGVAAVIGDHFAFDVLYSGAAPGLINGVMQINVRIPPGTPTGRTVPITVFAALYTDYFCMTQPGVTIAVQ